MLKSKFHKRFVNLPFSETASNARGDRDERDGLYDKLGDKLGLDVLVFTSVAGNPIDPRVLTHAFKKICEKAGLPNVGFHDLRHTFASLMLLRGAKPKVISEALGHSSVAFTMDTYSHIIEGMRNDALTLLNEVLPPGISGRTKELTPI